MPSPPISPQEPRTDRIVRLLPRIDEKANIAPKLMEFLAKEWTHWQADLEKRQQEGEYYLDWLDEIDAEASELNISQTFLRLVRQEIPALQARIKAMTQEPEEFDLDQVFAHQQTYLQLCKRYDHIKLGLLEQMDWRSNLEIY